MRQHKVFCTNALRHGAEVGGRALTVELYRWHTAACHHRVRERTLTLHAWQSPSTKPRWQKPSRLTLRNGRWFGSLPGASLKGGTLDGHAPRAPEEFRTRGAGFMSLSSMAIVCSHISMRGRVVIYTRSGLDWTARFPTVADAVASASVEADPRRRASVSAA